MKTIYLAGGCFWGVQKFFDQFPGVIRTETGYANGSSRDTTYEAVCRGSGHAETVRIDFDEESISLTELLEYYFMIIDPLSYNRQGPDAGIQYRTGIYYEDGSLLPEAQAVYDAKEAETMREFFEPLAVELKPLENYCRAEKPHQKYLDKFPGGYCHIPKRLLKLHENNS